MQIHNYKESTKEFISESTARPNPLEPDNYLIPKNATTIAPTVTPGENEVLVFENNTWIVKEDHRGTVVYNEEYREGKTIDTIGPLPTGFVLEAPTSEYDELIDNVWVKNEEQELQDWRENTSAEAIQVRRALRQSGKSQTVKDYMATASDEVQEEWEYSTIINRNSLLSDHLKLALNSTDEEMDNFFSLAITL
ncbi:MAG: hypothetical protein ACOCV8_01390 [Spirochaetota bacterium]